MAAKRLEMPTRTDPTLLATQDEIIRSIWGTMLNWNEAFQGLSAAVEDIRSRVIQIQGQATLDHGSDRGEEEASGSPGAGLSLP